MHLIKTVSDDGDAESSHPPRPSWMRVLAMEIMRGYVRRMTLNFRVLIFSAGCVVMRS